MNRSDINYRPLKRVAICRGCDEELSIGTLVIATYSIINKGQYIYFCTSCVETMNKLIKQNNETN